MAYFPLHLAGELGGYHGWRARWEIPGGCRPVSRGWSLPGRSSRVSTRWSGRSNCGAQSPGTRTPYLERPGSARSATGQAETAGAAGSPHTASRAAHTSRNDTATVFVLWVLVWLNGEVMGRRFAARGATHETALARMSFMLLYVMLPHWITIVSIRRERAARELLRDGELTVGCSGDGSYQFWTPSGERFEHRGAITSSATDVLTDARVVPVL